MGRRWEKGGEAHPSPWMGYARVEKERLGRGRDRLMLGKCREKEDACKVAKGIPPLST